jgi:3',5'-cyclic AMP phosphodiesterase CpdA
MRSLIHISDLHFGRIRPETTERLLQQIEKMKPQVVCVSGDLTQRARTSEFEAAKTFLSELKIPHLVVPGNHDVPLWNIYQRFFEPFKKYCRYIGEDLSPTYEDAEILIQGLSTARSLTFSGGKLRDHHVEEALEKLERRGAGKFKVVVSHHPLDVFNRFERGPWGRESYVLADRFGKCHVDLYLCGHLHAVGAQSTSEFHDEPHHSAMLVKAGTSTSSRLRHETNSFNLIEIEENTVRVRYYCFRDRDFLPEDSKVFAKNETGWHLKN